MKEETRADQIRKLEKARLFDAENILGTLAHLNNILIKRSIVAKQATDSPNINFDSSYFIVEQYNNEIKKLLNL